MVKVTWNLKAWDWEGEEEPASLPIGSITTIDGKPNENKRKSKRDFPFGFTAPPKPKASTTGGRANASVSRNKKRVERPPGKKRSSTGRPAHNKKVPKSS